MTVLITKIITYFMKLFGFGATTLPGRIALCLNKSILKKLSKGVKVIIVTGTNGKTTSSRIIERGLEESGVTYFANRSGANLITGITTSFIMNSTVFGRAKKEFAVIECDENAFVGVSKYIEPKAVLVTNVFRDQLDRYGEVSQTLEAIRKSVNNVKNATLILNADCSLTNTLYRNNAITFGISVPLDDTSSVKDGMYCNRCKEKLNYDYYTYAHLGKYSCKNCGYERKKPNYEITDIIDENEYSTTVPINDDTICKVNLGGIYNIYNALGAYTTLRSVGFSKDLSLSALSSFNGAFGRLESFNNEKITVILVKNPVGLTQTCNYISKYKGEKTIVFSLNDEAADGRDVSWIWDAEVKANAKVLTYGKRSCDMALRLYYGGIKSNVCNDIISLCKNTNGKIFIVPTYTSMMSIRKELIKEFGGADFWK